MKGTEEAARQFVLAVYRGQVPSCGADQYRTVRRAVVKAMRYLHRQGDENRASWFVAALWRLDLDHGQESP